MTSNDSVSSRVFQPGEIIMEEGQKGNHLYLIISGSVNVYQNKGDDATLITTMSSGDILGEMGILSNEPRNATAIASTECKTVMINDQALNHALLNDRLPIIKPLTNQLVLRYKEAEKANRRLMQKIAELEAQIAQFKSQQHTEDSH